MLALQCELCGSRYIQKGSSKAHVKSVAGFVCDVCGKALASKTSLEDLCCVHTVVKAEVHIYGVCGKTFAWSTSFSFVDIYRQLSIFMYAVCEELDAAVIPYSSQILP
jgi:hypothetical protein